MLGDLSVISRWYLQIYCICFDNHEKGAEQTDYANVDNEWHAEVERLGRCVRQRNKAISGAFTFRQRCTCMDIF